jgi:hydroxyacylglutathione hydrolase
VVLEIHSLPVLNDNYVYLLREPNSGAVAAVDPSVAVPVAAALDRLGWTLTHILNTHHHWDHTGGNLELKGQTGCVIVGPRADEARIPGIDVAVGENERYRFGNEEAEIFDIPGHTRGHIAFHFRKEKAVFCGDTLFSLGCGRMFEGTPPMMWASLDKLRRLPGETRVFCGHEYTAANARFAVSIDPENAALRRREGEVAKLRAADKATIPSTMAEECAANPFLRADDPGVAAAVNRRGGTPAEVFGEIRRLKDNFK